MRAPRIATFVVAALLALSACGGNDSSSTSDDPETGVTLAGDNDANLNDSEPAEDAEETVETDLPDPNGLQTCIPNNDPSITAAYGGTPGLPVSGPLSNGQKLVCDYNGETAFDSLKFFITDSDDPYVDWDTMLENVAAYDSFEQGDNWFIGGDLVNVSDLPEYGGVEWSGGYFAGARNDGLTCTVTVRRATTEEIIQGQKDAVTDLARQLCGIG